MKESDDPIVSYRAGRLYLSANACCLMVVLLATIWAVVMLDNHWAYITATLIFCAGAYYIQRRQREFDTVNWDTFGKLLALSRLDIVGAGNLDEVWDVIEYTNNATIDYLFCNIDVKTVDTTMAICLLTATLHRKKKLRHRTQFLNKLMAREKKKRRLAEVRSLFAGL